MPPSWKYLEASSSDTASPAEVRQSARSGGQVCGLHAAQIRGQTPGAGEPPRTGLMAITPELRLRGPELHAQAAAAGTQRCPRPGRRLGRQRGLCSVHATFFCSSAMAKRTQLSSVSRSLQPSGARLPHRQGALSSSASSCLLASSSCSSEAPSRCRGFLWGGRGAGWAGGGALHRAQPREVAKCPWTQVAGFEGSL